MLYVIGLTQSNSVFLGIVDTECSMLKLFDQVLDGEIKQSLPRWTGIGGINGILKDINQQILNLRSGTLDNLYNQIIASLKRTFKADMVNSGEKILQ